jgi:hypothetical protein
MAERLPVASVPKQGHVTLVGDNMVDLSGRHDFTAPVVLGTQRVLGQETFARLLPLVSISTLATALSLLLDSLCSNSLG